MNDTELAFRCVELAVKSGAQGDPGALAGLYFAAVKRLAPHCSGAATNVKTSESAGKAKAPATAGKTARRKPAQNS